jgi:large subunit ribosomal protein L22
MDATASLSNYRQSPRKVRLVADLVRGKTAEHALALLSQLPKRASDPMAKLIKSAVANAQGKDGAAAKELIISEIQVNGGIVFKRSMPRARGKAAPIKKRTSHITLALAHKTAPAATPRATSGQAK